ncbi:MAG: EAL domain-containing protein [Oscillospiraceae bacterium]
MQPKKTSLFAGRRPFLMILVTTFLLCTMVIYACFQYYSKLQETVRAESGGYLQEISKQISVNAGKTIADNFSILGTVAMVLENSHADSLEQLNEILLQQREHWNFKRILLVDADGIAYASDGHSTLLDNDAYLQTAVVDRKRSLSTSQMMDGTECVVFALPLDNLSVDGTQLAALVATYDLSTFDRILSMTAFDGQGYGHIIRRDGRVVIRSSSPYAAPTGYNILATLAGAPFAGDVTPTTLRTDISAGKAGQAELTLDGVPLYMSYTPLETEEWYLLTFVPVEVANAKSILLLRLTVLLCVGISMVFGALQILLLLTTYRHKRRLEQLAYVDPITGGNTIQRFYVEAEALLSASSPPPYALAYTNISKFKVLNEQLGRAACDTILATTEKSIRQDLDDWECVGRLFADNFCVLLQYRDEAALARRLAVWNANYARLLRETGSTGLPLSVDVGVYVLEDYTLPVQDMIDRAKLALREMPHKVDARIHYAMYDQQVRHRLLREKQLEDMMVGALAAHEFEVYLQPKYRTGDERIGGAEALVRWNSSVEGMIYPDEFISLFEKNGFIIRLDLWVFEQVCLAIRSWLDAGRVPMRISVNCSRVHLKTPGFLMEYSAIAAQHNIPPSLLEIELTENVVFEDVDTLTKIIGEIHQLGFSCSMDDFGSGYSSLNLIRDIPVDVLKLDKVFFRSGTGDLERTESVVASILTMARALSMETVAEGVEERTQVDMLQRLGCDYIQGYYFARPMPIPDFEALAFGQA